MLYTCDTNYRFFVSPVTKTYDDGVKITTWKYDNDQTYFNFEIQFPQNEENLNNFYWEDGSFFEGDFRDMIQSIGSVLLKDNLIIISGQKEKGNETE